MSSDEEADQIEVVDLAESSDSAIDSDSEPEYLGQEEIPRGNEEGPQRQKASHEPKPIYIDPNGRIYLYTCLASISSQFAKEFLTAIGEPIRGDERKRCNNILEYKLTAKSLTEAVSKWDIPIHDIIQHLTLFSVTAIPDELLKFIQSRGEIPTPPPPESTAAANEDVVKNSNGTACTGCWLCPCQRILRYSMEPRDVDPEPDLRMKALLRKLPSFKKCFDIKEHLDFSTFAVEDTVQDVEDFVNNFLEKAKEIEKEEEQKPKRRKRKICGLDEYDRSVLERLLPVRPRRTKISSYMEGSNSHFGSLSPTPSSSSSSSGSSSASSLFRPIYFGKRTSSLAFGLNRQSGQGVGIKNMSLAMRQYKSSVRMALARRRKRPLPMPSLPSEDEDEDEDDPFVYIVNPDEDRNWLEDVIDEAKKTRVGVSDAEKIRKNETKPSKLNSFLLNC